MKHTKPKSLEELTLLNRFLFATVMDDPSNMQLLLEMIFSRDMAFIEQTQVEEPDLSLEDDATRIFLNTRGEITDGVAPELIDLLHYMEDPNRSDFQTDSDKLIQLKENVQKVQRDAKVGARYMQKWEEDILIREEGREEGIIEGEKMTKLRLLNNLMQSQGIDMQIAMNLLGITADEIDVSV